MRVKKRRVDICFVVSATINKQEAVQKCYTIANDIDKDLRVLQQECVICFNDFRIGGTTSTITECALCDKEIFYANTNIDILCIDCAKEHNLCKHCGADINLEHRRKL